MKTRTLRFLIAFAFLLAATPLAALQVDLAWVETNLALKTNGTAVVTYKIHYKILSGEMHAFYFQGAGGESPVFDERSCKAIDGREKEYPLSLKKVSPDTWDVLLADNAAVTGEATFILVYESNLAQAGYLVHTKSQAGEQLVGLNWSTVGWDESLEHATLYVHYPIIVEQARLAPQDMEKYHFRTEKWMNERYLLSYYGQSFEGENFLTVQIHWSDVPARQGLKVQQYIGAEYFPSPAPPAGEKKPKLREERPGARSPLPIVSPKPLPLTRTRLPLIGGAFRTSV